MACCMEILNKKLVVSIVANLQHREDCISCCFFTTIALFLQLDNFQYQYHGSLQHEGARSVSRAEYNRCCSEIKFLNLTKCIISSQKNSSCLFIIIFPSAKKVMFSSVLVCMFVYLSFSKITEILVDRFCETSRQFNNFIN